MKSKILHKMRAALLLLVLCLAGKLLHAQTYTFTNAGATGVNGPTQLQVTNAYSATNLAGNVTVTGSGIQNWTVPVGGLYKIEVYGANGYGVYGGKGAYMSGEFNFNASDALKLLVGQMGGCCNGAGTNQYGGGGGSFVVDAVNSPIIIAGGGGGASTFFNSINLASSHNAVADASITTTGKTASGGTVGAGGTAGNGGSVGNTGGGGGGLLTDGGSSTVALAQGGKSFLNGGMGGNAATGLGGFGGGGGISGQNNMRAGGGGGYSGGGGCGSSTTVPQIGGGGGSYNSGANQVNTPGLGTGHGSVVITLLIPAVSIANNTGATGFPSLATGICPGSQSVSVKVRNYGNNFVSSLKIAWQVNGILQNDILYPVALDPYPGPVYEATITVGSYIFGPGTHTIKAWTSLPNNQPDADNTNDTTTYTVPVQLTGTYTVNSGVATGGTNFQTFTDFATALASYGVCGAVVADVAIGSGPYVEQITIPQVNGGSATNTITINGNGCTLSQTLATTGTNYATFRLDGADYVTVNNLNFEALGATYGFGIHLGNAADNNSFNNCNVTINPTATATTSAGVVMSGSPIIYSTAGQNGSNNTFTGCNVTGGYFGFTFYGTSVAGNSNNSIINCTAKEYYVYGSYNLQQGNAMISGNIFERPTRAATSTFYGVILTTGCINMLVEKNIVRNAFTMQPTGTSAAYPLYCAVDGTPGNENKFINNLVYNINNNGIVYAMYFSAADYIQAYHNTISLDHTASTAGDTYGIYSTGTVGGMDFKNNDISITRGGTGAKYCLYFSGGLQSSNNNNLYINSAAGTNAVGFYGVAFTTLANWQTANSSAYDALSQSLDPLYLNPAGGDFTPTNPGIDNLGVYVNVNTDIIGNPRSPATPDIGAYETASAPCTSPPVAGSATANPISGLCGGASIAVNLSGLGFGAGQTYQWEESTTFSGPYTAVSASLISPATTLTSSNTVYYRAAVTCNSNTSYSTPVLVTVGAIGGTATTPSNTVCYGGNVGLALSGHTGNNIQWEYLDIPTATWIAIGGATTANYTVNNVQASTDYRAAVSCNTPGGTDYSNTVSITVINPSVTDVFPGSRCDAGPVTLAAKGSTGTIIKWYDALTAGNLLGTGGAYTTPSISTTTTYYAAAATGSGGSGTPALPAHGSNYNGNVRGMWFTAPVSFTITSLQALAVTTGSQSLAVVKLAAPAPIYPAVTNTFTVLYLTQNNPATGPIPVGSSRVDLQACKLEYSIVSPK